MYLHNYLILYLYHSRLSKEDHALVEKYQLVLDHVPGGARVVLLTQQESKAGPRRGTRGQSFLVPGSRQLRQTRLWIYYLVFILIYSLRLHLCLITFLWIQSYQK